MLATISGFLMKDFLFHFAIETDPVLHEVLTNSDMIISSGNKSIKVIIVKIHK